MRLDPREVRAIKAAAAHAFGPDVVVRLFGSRVDDSRRGGDIDLHLETAPLQEPSRLKERFLENLFARIDEQRVDVIVRRRDDAPTGIDLIALRDGIVL